MKRHMVCLTFDFDALSLWIARGMITPTPISRGEFGAVAAERLLDLLGENRIKATWFIPGLTIETYPDLCARICKEGHEIGCHGYAHESPVNLPRDREEAILVRSREVIRRLAGYNPKGYRSPSWDLSESSVDLLLKYGFVYDSSMMAHDYVPYRVRAGDVVTADAPAKFGKPTRLVEISPSWSLDDFPHFEYVRDRTYLQPGLARSDDVLQNWLDDFRYMKRIVNWGVITYTLHPQVIGRGHRILMLERLIKRLVKSHAVFVRMDAVAEEFEKKFAIA